jgi:hypothetical protein
MDKVIFGDNQFFAINHLSDEKSRQQSIRFRTDAAIIKVLDDAIDVGLNTFMCTTHDRIASLCEAVRNNPEHYRDFKIYPCMPYAHKYANAVTDFGILGTIKRYVPGNIFGTFAKGSMAYLNKDFIKLMEIFVDAEMKMFSGINTPVIFIQNVVTDLILGLGMYDVLAEYDKYIRKKYKAEPGYITMNMPLLLDALNSVGVRNPIICFSFNKSGFRMSGGKALYEKYLNERQFRPIAMQVLAAGALSPSQAIQYVGQFKKIESVLFGASSRNHIEETKKLIEKYL